MESALEKPLARRSIAAVGALLLAVYGLLLIPVAVNLPVSWPGFVYVAIGIVGGGCSFAFLRYRRRLLLIPVAVAVLMTAAWAVALLYFGEAIDRQLQTNRHSSAPSSIGGAAGDRVLA
jgi:hypothetical protein